MSLDSAGRELCEVFGLDPTKVNAIVIRYAAGDVTRVRVSMVDTDDDGIVVRTIARYRLERMA